MDLILAIAHHAIVFIIVALFGAELFIVRHDMGRSAVLRVSRIDMAFGALAGAILVVGFLRVFLGLQPESFYLRNPFFWAKIAAFVVVGLISIVPTRRFIAWARAAQSDTGFVPAAAEVATIRRLLWLEACIFLLVPAFAAVMADGYGL
jgi:putative membrane protein